MATIKRRALPPAAERELAYYKARVEQLEATLAYVAVMADVEVPEEEEAESYGEDEV